MRHFEDDTLGVPEATRILQKAWERWGQGQNGYERGRKRPGEQTVRSWVYSGILESYKVQGPLNMDYRLKREGVMRIVQAMKDGTFTFGDGEGGVRTLEVLPKRRMWWVTCPDCGGEGVVEAGEGYERCPHCRGKRHVWVEGDENGVQTGGEGEGGRGSAGVL